MKCSLDIRTDSLQGKIFKFLGKESKENVAKVFGEGSITPSSNKIKNKLKLLSLLGDASELFKKHGMFWQKDNKVIQEFNLRFLENLFDSTRLVTRINDKANFGYNVISSKKFQGSHWVVSRNKAYTKDLPFEKQEQIRDRILKKNLARIEVVNDNFKKVTGKPGIKVTKVGQGYKVSFDSDVLLAYNIESYVHYVNSMLKYINRNEDTINENFEESPIETKLRSEKRYLRKKKATLERKGGALEEVNRLENKIQNVSTRLKAMQEELDLKDIYNEAKIDLVEIEELLNRVEMSPGDVNDALKKLQLWIKSGDFSAGEHLFLDSEQLSNETIRDEFSEIAKEATKLIQKLDIRGESVLENTVNKGLQTELSYEKITSLPHKLGSYSKQVLSLNRVGNALAQFIQKTVNEASNSAVIEVNQKSKDLAELYKAVKDSGFDERNFLQRHNGIFTGKLLSKFSKDYGDKTWYKYNKYNRKKYLIDLDPSKLFSPNTTIQSNYRKMLIAHLGEVSVDAYIDLAKRKYKEYKTVRDAFIKSQFGDGALTKIQEKELELWKVENSPIYRLKAIEATKNKNLNEVVGKDTFLVTIPRKFIGQEETGFYDKNFDLIEQNPAAYAFYKEAERITRHANIAFGSGSFTETSLAYIKRSLLSKWNENGVAHFLTRDVYDAILKEFTATEPQKDEIDPVTGKPIMKIKQEVFAIDKVIDVRVTKKTDQFKEDNPEKEVTEELLQQFLLESSEEIFQEMGKEGNLNLFQSLNMLNLAATGFHHKMFIEDQVNLAMTYLPKSTVNTGNDIIDSAGNPVGEGYIDNMTEMAENFLRVQYYGKGKQDTSSILKRIYTKEDKARKKRIEELLKNKENLSVDQIEVLKEELANLGGDLTTNVVIRRIMDFLRLKGLGWNLPAAMANLAYGKITNLYAAFDKRVFTPQELGKAEKLIFTETKKFNNVVENYNILGDILFEFKQNNRFEEKKNWFFKAIKSLKPYALQTGTEKQNQGVVMIAMLLHNKVTDIKTGEQKSMWEAIGQNGRLRDNWSFETLTGEEAITNMVSRIKSQVEEIHGDYSNPLLIKSTIGGQALGMFKMWFFEALHSRIGQEKEDYIRKITTKGRYRTTWELLRDNGVNFKEIYRKYKSNEMSAVDAANMRKNFIAMATLIMVFVLKALLKSAICDDDEKCKDANFAQLALMNLTKRVTSEISFYSSPKEWYQFLKNPAATTSVLGDLAELLRLSEVTITGDWESLTYKQGYNKDKSRWSVYVQKQIPFVGQARRFEKYGSELLNFGN